MKLVILLAAALIAGNASAMTNAEICTFRGRLVESAALMRDAGKTEAQTMAEVKKQFLKQLKRPAPASMSDYVKAVYMGKEFSAAQLRRLAESLCIEELGE